MSETPSEEPGPRSDEPAPRQVIDKGGPKSREHALAILVELIARGGAAPFLLPPVIPGEEAFPDAWAPSRVGVELLLRRLLRYADLDFAVMIDDRRAGAPPTERKPA